MLVRGFVQFLKKFFRKSYRPWNVGICEELHNLKHCITTFLGIEIVTKIGYN